MNGRGQDMEEELEDVYREKDVWAALVPHASKNSSSAGFWFWASGASSEPVQFENQFRKSCFSTAREPCYYITVHIVYFLAGLSYLRF